MYNRLLSIMSSKNILAMILFSFMVASGCTKDDENSLQTKCSINGVIDAYGGGSNIHLGGFKIRLESTSNSSTQHIAISDETGAFLFQDIEVGTYTISVIKEGYEWVYMSVDGNPNQQNRTIEIYDGETKNIRILMRGHLPTTSDFPLELTDIYGNPIGNSIHVPKYATNVAFRLYNGTGYSHSWSVSNTENLFVSDDNGYYSERIFDSFSQTSGTLNPGESTIIVGTINQNIFNLVSNTPHFSILDLWFYCGYTQKEVTLDIDF